MSVRRSPRRADLLRGLLVEVLRPSRRALGGEIDGAREMSPGGLVPLRRRLVPRLHEVLADVRVLRDRGEHDHQRPVDDRVDDLEAPSVFERFRVEPP
eukprot:14810-Pelagococcus_subviridis.AAC.6